MAGARGNSELPGWGWLLAGAAGLLAWRGAWAAVGVVGLTWAVFVLVARPARCGVETAVGGPCDRPVAGLLGTCGWHAGRKWRAVPVLVRDGELALPRLVWPRPAGAPHAPARCVPPAPPRPVVRPADDARREHRLFLVAVVGLVAATSAFAHHLIAG
jgi:hypothetical protein